jgi:spore coat polysaccharide biosynthesis protein SpsF
MLCIVQARMSSKRLKGKTLLNMKGKPLLERVLSSLVLSKKIKKIVVATSNKKSDDKIINFCKKKNFLFTRGSLTNVALRYIQTLKIYPCDVFLRITGDSPFINHKIIDKIITLSKRKKFDIYTNTFPRTFPKGQSVEIINTNSFLKNYKYFNKYQKEHLTSYFYQEKKKFIILNFKSAKDISSLNLSVDTKEDFIRLSNSI